MSKQKTEIQKPETQTTALAGPSPYARSFAVPEDLQRFLQVPAMHLHQGTISEKAYGEHPKGALINTATKEAISSRRFVLLSSGFVEYEARGEEDAKGRRPLIYKTRNRKEVPPQDFQWHDDEPPVCVTTWYGPALFEGTDGPVAVALKFTSKEIIKAYNLIAQVEQQRAAAQKPPALWEYGFVSKENDKGKWIIPEFKMVGNPPEALLQQAAQWYEAAATAVVDSGPTQQHEPEFDPDAE